MINQQGQKLYAFTLLVAFSYISILGFLTAIEFGRIASVQQQPLDTFASTLKMDARNYQQIVEQGYNYHEDKRSLVAFFPIYPKLCSVVIKVAGWRTDECMLVVANFFLLLTYVVLYLLGMSLTPSCQQWALALFCLFPSTLFFRLGYAESMLCFFITMTLLGMQRQWPLWVVAVFAGLASGTRPVGFAMSIAVLWYVVVSCYDKNKTLASNTARLLWVIPVSCCGLIVYVCYLWWAFSAPLSFAHTQDHWTFLAPCGSTAWDKICSLVTLEPIWNVYNPHSQRYWINGDTQDNPLFSCLFWNPIFYLLAWFLIGLGWYKKWLKDYEIVLSVGLLLIPYVTRAYEMSMASHARFAAVVIPQYFVLGRLFAMMPPAIAGCLCGLMGLMMGLWTALFVAGYRFF